MSAQVSLISGDLFNDHRGTLKFVNDFNFDKVKRFYQIIHPDISVIRAWQGHQIEHKYFYVAKGRFAIAWVKIDNWDQPSADLHADYKVLDEAAPAVLSVPPGYANGIKALDAGSILVVYSDALLQDSALDRWSFDQSLWMNWEELA